MGTFFVILYTFFSRRRWLLWILLSGIMAVSVWFTMNLRMDEQITSKATGGGKAGKMQAVATGIGLTDNLIIRISPVNSQSGTQEMSDYASCLTDSLLKKFDSTYIASVSPDPSDTSFLWLSGLMADHLPIYLEEKDYGRLDTLIQPERIRQSMESMYRLLTTPAGMVMRERLLKDPLGLSGIAFEKLRNLQAGENYKLIGNFVFTADEKNLLLFISSANPAGETAKNGRLLAGIQQQIDGLKGEFPGIEAEAWGGIAMAAGNAEQLKKDIMLTLTLALILIFLLVAAYFRNFWIPLAGFMPALFGGLLSLAGFYLARGTISAIALGIGAVLLGLIVDYALYIINRYRRTGDVPAVLREMSQTVVLCALTSIGAFSCLLFLESGVLFDLGLFAGFSLAGAALFSLIFLPHLLGSKLIRSEKEQKRNLLDRFCALPLERSGWLTGGILALLIASLLFARNVRFEEDMNALNFVTPELKAAGERLDRISEVNLKSVYVVSEGQNLEDALAASAAAVPAIRSLEKTNLVRNVSGVQSLLLPSGIEQERLARWTRFWTTDKADRVKKQITSSCRDLGIKPEAFEPFFRMISEPGSGLAAGEKSSLAATALRNWVRSTDTVSYVTTILKVAEADRPSVYRSLNGIRQVTVFDRQELTNRFVDSVRSDFGKLVSLTMIFVTLLLILSLGRIETGLITAIPMFASWLLTLGFMGLTGIRFNIFNIIISSFIFGLGVDYSILMMRGLVYKYKYGRDDTENYKVSIFLSAATTVIGVAVLFAARHPALHSIALVAVFGVTAVVLVTWTIEPLAVKWMLLDRQQKKAFPVFGRAFIHAIFLAWIPITSIAVIMVLYATLISPVLPLKKKKKQHLFHRLFCLLSKGYIALNFPKHHRIENETGEDFRKPAILITNHQSLIETPALLRLHPNILIITNAWVFRNWVFGPVARAAGFIPITTGIEDSLDLMQERIREGYSILIFPEGSRSMDGHIQLFHRGAFYIAEKLQLDLVPILIFGSGDFLRKTDFWGKPNRLFMRIMPRIRPDDLQFGTTYQERARSIRQLYIREYAAFRLKHGTPDYYRRTVIQNYLFKGPVLEWYVRIKMKLEDNFRLYHKHLPLKGNILDLGCGYGYLTHMLALTSPDRTITGVDHDEEKISVAENCFSCSKRTRFVTADLTVFSFGPHDGIVLGDVLHYLPEETQQNLLIRCLENLAPDGILLIREGLRDESAKHRRTRLTEFFSTRSGFNKTMGGNNELHFLSFGFIRELAESKGMAVIRLAEKRKTSNTLLKICRTVPGHEPNSNPTPKTR